MVTKFTCIWRSIYKLSTPKIIDKGEKVLQDPKQVEKETIK